MVSNKHVLSSTPCSQPIYGGVNRANMCHHPLLQVQC